MCNSLQLVFDQIGVNSVLGEQIHVAAALDDAAVLEDEYHIGADDGGQSVGDHDCSLSAPGALEGLLEGCSKIYKVLQSGVNISNFLFNTTLFFTN